MKEAVGEVIFGLNTTSALGAVVGTAPTIEKINDKKNTRTASMVGDYVTARERRKCSCSKSAIEGFITWRIADRGSTGNKP